MSREFSEFTNNETMQNFTSDAWKMLLDYLNNLEDKIEEYHIPIPERVMIKKGVLSYIEEYMDDRSGGLISFDEVLNLINSIGSPVEIINSTSSVDIREEYSADPSNGTQVAQAFCTWCGVANSVVSHFCQNCGNQIGTRARPRSRLMQNIIDAPYKSTFLISFLLLSFIYTLDRIIDDSSKSLTDAMFGSMWSALLPSFIIMIVVGFTIDKIYKDDISFKKKYEKVREEYEEIPVLLFVLGMCTIMPMMGIVAGFSSGKNDFMAVVMVMIAFVIIIVLLVVFVASFTEEPTPDTIQYLDLLNYKEKFRDHVGQQAKYNTQRAIPWLLVVIGTWYGLIFPALVDSSLLDRLVTTIFLGASLIASTYFISYLSAFSWKELKKFIQHDKSLNKN